MLPTARLTLTGVTVIVKRIAELTFTFVVVLMPLNVAVTTEVPVARAVTIPLVATADETVAIVGAAEVKLLVLVTLTLLPSVYFAVTVNCCVVPICMGGFAGVKAMDSKLAGVMVTRVVPIFVPDIALITDEPAATPVASPVLLIVAAAGVAEVKLEMAVMSLVVPSE